MLISFIGSINPLQPPSASRRDTWLLDSANHLPHRSHSDSHYLSVMASARRWVDRADPIADPRRGIAAQLRDVPAHSLKDQKGAQTHPIFLLRVGGSYHTAATPVKRDQNSSNPRSTCPLRPPGTETDEFRRRSLQGRGDTGSWVIHPWITPLGRKRPHTEDYRTSARPGNRRILGRGAGHRVRPRRDTCP